MNFRLSINIIFYKSTPAARSDDKYDFNKVTSFMGIRRLRAYHMEVRHPGKVRYPTYP